MHTVAKYRANFLLICVSVTSEAGNKGKQHFEKSSVQVKKTKKLRPCVLQFRVVPSNRDAFSVSYWLVRKIVPTNRDALSVSYCMVGLKNCVN